MNYYVKPLCSKLLSKARKRMTFTDIRVTNLAKEQKNVWFCFRLNYEWRFWIEMFNTKLLLQMIWAEDPLFVFVWLHLIQLKNWQDEILPLFCWNTPRPPPPPQSRIAIHRLKSFWGFSSTKNVDSNKCKQKPNEHFFDSFFSSFESFYFALCLRYSKNQFILDTFRK